MKKAIRQAFFEYLPSFEKQKAYFQLQLITIIIIIYCWIKGELKDRLGDTSHSFTQSVSSLSS